MPFAVVLILLVVGSIIFHVLSPWWFTELASNWAMVDCDDGHYVLRHGPRVCRRQPVHGVLRHQVSLQERKRERPTSRKTKLENWLTVLTAIGVAAMLTPGSLSGPIS